MSRIICYSNHIVPSKDNGHAEGLLDYIATRDGVELNREKKMTQQELIDTIILSHPKVIQVCSNEYDKYIETGNKFQASKFITAAMDYITSLSESPDIYLKYISNRPGVIKNENMNHGLFNQNGFADLKLERENLQKKIEKDPDAPIWNHIISLTREDAVKFGYDNQEAWKQLLQAQMPQIANDMHIDLKNLVWNAAFHDEGHHPHVHIQMYSKDPQQGYVSVHTLEKIKSRLANQIFKQELDVLKVQRTNFRNTFEYEMKKEIQKYYKELQTPFSKDGVLNLSDYERLASQIQKGTYQYQKKEVKEEVQEIIYGLSKTERLQKSIDDLYKNFRQFELYYKEDEEKLTTREKFEQDLLIGKIGHRNVIHNFLIDTLKNKNPEISKLELNNISEEQMLTLQKNEMKSIQTLSKITNKKYKIENHTNAIKEMSKSIIENPTFDLSEVKTDSQEVLLVYAVESDAVKKQFGTYCSAKAKLLNTTKEDIEQRVKNGQLGNELNKAVSIAISKQFKLEKQQVCIKAINHIEEKAFDSKNVKPLIKAMIYAERPVTEINQSMIRYISQSELSPIDQYYLYQNTVKEILIQQSEENGKITFSEEENKLLYRNYYLSQKGGADEPPQNIQNNVGKRIAIELLYSVSRMLEKSEREAERNMQQQARNQNTRNNDMRNKNNRNRKRGVSYA